MALHGMDIFITPTSLNHGSTLCWALTVQALLADIKILDHEVGSLSQQAGLSCSVGSC